MEENRKKNEVKKRRWIKKKRRVAGRSPPHTPTFTHTQAQQAAQGRKKMEKTPPIREGGAFRVLRRVTWPEQPISRQ